ncbi:MAG: TonB-dependent receptor, partial [bacterium]|nr:TonB-dependent receptor [Candidatus Kapabacteria bacterium]
GIPLATVTPIEATDRGAVMLTYRNYGDITLYGYDIGLQVALTDGLVFNGSLSYVDKNFFENLDGVADLSLNAPKFKFTTGLDYSNAEIGLNANIRMRHVDGYRVRSGVYVGDVQAFSTVDLGVGYRLPWVEGMSLSLSAQNLMTFVDGGEEGPFSQRHNEFVGASQILGAPTVGVGAPALGRLILARLTYSFK